MPERLREALANAPAATATAPPSKPTAQLETVTPELAEQWLEQNHSNRNVRNARLSQYATDMSNASWHITGETIKFDWNGKMVDGQHRLMSVIDAGKPIETFVIRGLDPAAQKFMDTGAARMPADAMKLNGEKNAMILASASRLGLRIELGLLFGKSSNHRVSHSQILDWLDRHPTMRRSAELATSWNTHIDLPQSVLAYAHYCFAQIDIYMADEFFQRMASLSFDEGSPVKALTKQLASMNRADKKMTQRQQLLMCFRAWNAWREGRTLSRMYSATQWDDRGLPELV